jgi:hypothetical protein
MYQVVIKISRDSQLPIGPLTFEDPANRAEFVKRSDVWWYHYPEEDDWTTWHRGGAWDEPEPEAPEQPERTEEDDPWG